VSKEEQLLEEWMRRLLMGAWRIQLQTNVHPGDMIIEGAVGCSQWQESTSVALIQIIDPERYQGIVPFDFEKTLVHELLHLKLCMLGDKMADDESLRNRELHRMIEELARALVDAKRSGSANG